MFRGLEARLKDREALVFGDVWGFLAFRVLGFKADCRKIGV